MLELFTGSGIPVDSVFHGVWHVLLRFMVVCVGAMLVVRMMGNRTVGQLSPFDLVIMVGIGDIIISGAMDQRPTVLNCLVVLAILLILQQLMGYLALKSPMFRTWFEGLPVVVIQDGKTVKENLVRTQFNYDDLRQEMHKKGMDMTKLKDIKLGRLESCGYFSVIMNQDAEPLTKRDFEEYLKGMYDNPLSFAGEKWTKIEKLMNDMEYISTYLRGQNQQQPLYNPPPAFDPDIIADNFEKNPPPIH